MFNVKRRGFLGGVSGSLAGLFALGKLFTSENARAKGSAMTQALDNTAAKPLKTKLNVKLVFPSLIHSEAWEGPCRPSAGVSGDDERAAHRAAFKTWVEDVTKNISSDANMMRPELVEYVQAHKDFRNNEKEFSKLEADKDDVDLYLLTTGGAGQALTATVGKRFNKPVVMMSSGLQSIDASAHLRARGFEGYAVLDYGELNKLIRYLKTRKVFRQTNILLITNIPMPSYSEVSSVWDFDNLARLYGIGTKTINYGVMAEEMERVINSKDEEKRAQDLADHVIKNAQGVYLDKKYVFNSAQYYCTVKNLLDRFNCNAFTIECWEFCTSRLPQTWKIVPCLIHTLLKDEGYSSACQADISALLAIRLFMTLADRSVFMGNQFMDMKTELLMIGHSVPGLKMNGYDTPELPYTLRHFCESGWGTKVMVDFAANDEKTVTMVNTDPLAKKLMVAKGEIEKCIGFKEGDGRGTLIGCSLQAHLRMRDYRDFMYKQADFGTHVAMGYGDWIEDFKKLGPIIGMEVVDCS